MADETSHDDAYRRALARADAREQRRAEDDRVASVVRAEVDKRVLGWIWLLGLIALAVWKGWLGVGIWALCFVAWTAHDHWVQDRTPGNDGDAAERDAETYVRHSILADLHARGELRWEVKNDSVVVADHTEWDTFWSRLDQIVRRFEGSSPEERRREVAAAKMRSLAGRLEMTAFAREKGLKETWWATLEDNESRT